MLLMQLCSRRIGRAKSSQDYRRRIRKRKPFRSPTPSSARPRYSGHRKRMRCSSRFGSSTERIGISLPISSTVQSFDPRPIGDCRGTCTIAGIVSLVREARSCWRMERRLVFRCPNTLLRSRRASHRNSATLRDRRSDSDISQYSMR